MGWRNSEIEVYHTIDLSDYDDEIMEYLQPDTISDALELMEGWGFGDGDILDYMLESMDEESFLSRVSDVLTVETALALVKNVYEYGHAIQACNLTAKQNQIDELREKIRQLENPTTTEETTDESRSTDRTA
jgi:hypothetical protein